MVDNNSLEKAVLVTVMYMLRKMTLTRRDKKGRIVQIVKLQDRDVVGAFELVEFDKRLRSVEKRLELIERNQKKLSSNIRKTLRA